ncbi:MAG: hypothetical protein ACKOQ7_04570 [Actinomycetota bacterium]
MKFLRQAFLALSVAVAAAAVLRIKGKPAAGPQHGGWREVTPQR